MVPRLISPQTYCSLFLVFFLLTPKEFILNLTGLRIEDAFGIFAIFYCFFMRNQWQSKSIFLSYSAYLLYVGLHACISSSHLASSFVILGKYLSYLCFFYLFYEAMCDAQWPRHFYRVLNFSFTCLAMYGLYQVFTVNFFGEYGVSFPGHNSSPLSGAVMYFFCAILVDVLLRKKWGVLHLIFILLSLLGGSKTAFLMVLIYVVFTGNLKILIGFTLLASAIYFSLIRLDTEGHSLHRYNSFLDPINTLAERGIWHKLPDYSVEPYTLIFGKGIEYGHVLNGHFHYGMAFDNLFLYLISKDGLVGTFLFLCFIFSVVYSTRSLNGGDRRTINALLLGLLVGGLGAETFFLSVPALTLWVCLGITKGRALREAQQKSRPRTI